MFDIQQSSQSRPVIKQDLIKALRTHLRAEGMAFGLNDDQSEELLFQRLGPQKYAKFCKVMDRVRAGRCGMNNAYDVLSSVLEGNALMSAQAEVAIATNAAVISSCEADGTPGLRVAEVGCYAGSALRFLALRNPESTFTGFDGSRGLIDAANRKALRNCRFVQWDYDNSASDVGVRFDRIIGALCINYPATQCVDANSTDLSGALETYQRTIGPMRHWRQIVADDGICTVALRIARPVNVLGALNAIDEAGWVLGSDCPPGVVIEATGETFRIFKLRPSTSRDPSPPSRTLDAATMLWNTGFDENVCYTWG